jgi:signal transduction histidine kinase
MDPSECLDPMASLAVKLSNQRTIGGACDDALQAAMSITGAYCAEVLFRDIQSRQLLCLAHRGPYPWCVEQSGRRLGSRLAEATLQEQLPLYVLNVGSEMSLGFDMPSDAHLMKAASVPLVVRGRAIGAINLCGKSEADISADISDALSVVAALLAPVVENLFITERANSQDMERRQFLVREMEASEDERQHIARELHDGLGQTLTGLVMNIDGTMAMLAQPGKEQVAVAGLQRSRDAAASALQDIRRVILALRPTILDDMGLFAALEAYARKVLEEANIRVRVRTTGQPDRLSPVVENVVFRVMQEAINNVARHSQATNCRLILTSNQKTLCAAVEDDGIGFAFDDEAADGRHVGLKSMKERVDIIGGRLGMSSQPGSGTRVEVRVAHGGKHG